MRRRSRPRSTGAGSPSVEADLENPLTVAKGRLTLAAEECENEHLETVDGTLDRMVALVDDLLELARSG